MDGESPKTKTAFIITALAGIFLGLKYPQLGFLILSAFAITMLLSLVFYKRDINHDSFVMALVLGLEFLFMLVLGLIGT